MISRFVFVVFIFEINSGKYLSRKFNRFTNQIKKKRVRQLERERKCIQFLVKVDIGNKTKNEIKIERTKNEKKQKLSNKTKTATKRREKLNKYLKF